MDRFKIEWQAPEFEYRGKDIAWYWVSVILAIILLSAAIWQKNFLFGVFIIMAEILILVWANRTPQTVAFKLDEKGLTIGQGKFYSYNEIESFSVDDDAEDEWADVLLRFRSNLRPTVKIRVPKQRLAEIEKIFTPLVSRVEFQESFLETLERFLGF